MRDKKAQVTMFIIFGIIIVAAIALFFVFNSGVVPELNFGRIKSPQTFIHSCIKPELQKSIENISEQGGFKNPSNYLLYNGTKVSYLCHTSDYEKLCINKHPMLKQTIEKQIQNNLQANVEDCFNKLKENYDRDEYFAEPTMFEIEIRNKRVHLFINKSIKIDLGRGDIKTLDFFEITTPSPLLDFIKITGEIINQEVTCNCGIETCNADRVQILRENRQFKIDKFMTSRDEEIYTLINIPTKKEFNFAIRNCIKP
jgi:hypothetical protein